MKKLLLKIMLLLAMAAPAATASAQLYEIANQLPQIISPMLSGSFRYRGFVEASYTKGVGHYNADFFDVSTSQGFQYADWFYMGVGLGVGGMFTHPEDDWGTGWNGNPNYTDRYYGSGATSCVMLPVFTDFRFNIGDKSRVSFFADIKIGCAFLTGKKYMRINNGYLTQNEYFYLKPTVGMRIPVSSQHPKQAVDVGLSYQLLTSDYWYGPSTTATINSIGASVAFEW